MQYRDYYEVMGLGRDATQDEIKRKYRELARKYHPDVSKAADAEERFKEVGEAYEVLKDPEKRTAYDHLGADWQSGQSFNAPPDWDAGFEFSGPGFSNHGQFSDFFESLFGHGYATQGRPPDQSGQDHHAKILIDLEDAWVGKTKGITLQLPSVDGNGRLNTQTRTLNVKIPKGILAGQVIRLAGQGDPGIGAHNPGDLYLEIQFKSHPLYNMEGCDLYLKLPVSPWEAALGARVTVPTPGGPVKLTIPENASPGSRLRLKGRGMPCDPVGDLYAVLEIVLPKADSERAKAAYQAMSEQFDFDPRAGVGT